MSPLPQSNSALPHAGRWWRRRPVRVGLLLAVGLLGYGINGPLSRWFLPGIVQKIMARQGYEVDFKLRGTWLGGPTVQQLQLRGGGVTDLRLKRLSIDAPWTFLRRQTWHHWEIEGLEATIDLAALPSSNAADSPRDPIDPAAWVDQWQRLRPELLRHSLRVQTGKITLTRGGKPELSLASCQIRHEALDEVLDLQLGPLRFGDPSTTATRWNSLPAQHISCRMRAEEISLDQLQLMPQLRLTALHIATPRNRQLSAAADLELLQSRWKLRLMPWLSSAELRWQEGDIDLAAAAAVFGETSPVQGNIRAAELRLRPRGLPRAGWRSEPWGMDADLLLRVSNGRYHTYQLDDMVLDAQIQRQSGNLNFQVRNGNATMEARSQIEWPSEPLQQGQWWPSQVLTQLRSDAIAPWQQWWRQQQAADTTATALLPSDTLPPAAFSAVLHWKGDTTTPLNDCHATWHVEAADPALSLHGSFTTTMRDLAAPLHGSIQGNNWASQFSCHRAERTWSVSFSASDLSTAQLKPWLTWYAPAAQWPEARFSGAGECRSQPDAPHYEGHVAIQHFSWQREFAAAVEAKGRIDFRWPEQWQCRDLTIEQGLQTIQLDAQCAAQQLQLERLQWQWQAQTLLSAHGSMPLPAMPWNRQNIELLLRSSAPVDLTLESRPIEIRVLNEWLPAAQRFPISGHVQVTGRVNGTPQRPVIAVAAQAEGLQFTQAPELRPFKLQATLKSTAPPAAEPHSMDQHLRLQGTCTLPVAEPIAFSASMPFRTAAWSRDLDLLAAEPLEGQASLPAIDVARLVPVLPSLRTFGGELRGAARLSGSCSQPDLRVNAQWRKGHIASSRREIAALSDIAADASWQQSSRQLRVESLQARMADGRIEGQGEVDFAALEPQHIRFSLSGHDLPLWRNGYALLRGSARLQVQGPWLQARVSGALQLQHGMIYKDIELLPLATLFRVPIERHDRAELDAAVPWKLPNVPAPFDQWPLDFRVDSLRPLLMRGNLFRGQASAHLIARGSLGQPRFDGGLRVTELEAQLPFSRLSVPNASLLFRPAEGWMPTLDLKGRSKVGHHEVSVYLFGPLTQPRFELVSSPPLPQHDILSLLATGSTTGNLSQGNIASAKAAQLLVEEWRRGRVPLASAFLPLMSLTEHVDLAIGDANPYTGKKYASASIALARQRWFLTGAVDAEGHTRSLLMFAFRFR